MLTLTLGKAGASGLGVATEVEAEAIVPRVALLHLLGGVPSVVYGGAGLGEFGGEFGEAVGGHGCCG